jgi:hypothetical protein
LAKWEAKVALLPSATLGVMLQNPPKNTCETLLQSLQLLQNDSQ